MDDVAHVYTHTHRVRYRECDPMSVVYHTHYVDYFEMARTEAMRDLGLAYRTLEDDGIIMPVINVSVQYHAPAYYDDLLAIEAHFGQMPTVRVPIDYVVKRSDDDRRIASGHTDLCFMDADTRRPIRLPDRVHRAFASVLPT
ncbi:MAG: thioesterase family protein [Longimonas sp.]|uniref:acyl-CoA thioesterase n=1 Tax=Longimonas sp. TaxID=2039626 RepID=UPI0033578350